MPASPAASRRYQKPYMPPLSTQSCWRCGPEQKKALIKGQGTGQRAGKGFLRDDSDCVRIGIQERRYSFAIWRIWRNPAEGKFVI